MQGLTDVERKRDDEEVRRVVPPRSWHYLARPDYTLAMRQSDRSHHLVSDQQNDGDLLLGVVESRLRLGDLHCLSEC